MGAAALGQEVGFDPPFDCAVEIPIPGVEGRVVLDIADQVFAGRASLSHRERVVALPVGSAIAPRSVKNQVSAWVAVDEISDIVHFAMDHHPARGRAVMERDFIPSVGVVSSPGRLLTWGLVVCLLSLEVGAIMKL